MVEDAKSLGLEPLIPGYPIGSDITMLNVMYKYPSKGEDGKYDKGSATISFIDNASKETKHYIMQDPYYIYYLADKYSVKKYTQLFIEKEKVTRHIAPYRNLEKDIAKNTGNMDFYETNIKNGNRYGNKELHRLPEVFNSDMNINNHIRYIFDMMYTNTAITSIKKSYFDIEADTRYMLGDFPEMGECPVNALTFIDDATNSSHTFLLRDAKNPLIQEFENQCGPEMIHEIKDFVIKKVGGIKRAKVFKVDKLDFNLYFFDTEIDLLRAFYRLVHKLKPHFMIAWNNSFDTPYIVERIKNLGYDPADIMCDRDYDIKFVKYFIDTKNKDMFAERCDYYEISMDTVVLDQMVHFASRRKSKSTINSYRLDDIGEMIADVHKLDYSHITSDISMLPWLDYKTFVFYNIMDVIVQKCIESKTQDLEYVYSKCIINNTSFQKCHRQTVYLIDRFTKEFYNDGYIIGNNNNFNSEKERIRGASVSDPKHLNDYSKAKINGKPVMIAFNLVDFDYKSMHPSMILQNNMAPNTQIGVIQIPEQIYEFENRFGVEVWHRQEDFAEAITTGNVINLCERWMGLASYGELIDDVNEYLNKVYSYSMIWQGGSNSFIKKNDKPAVVMHTDDSSWKKKSIVFHRNAPDCTSMINDLRKEKVVCED